MTLALIAALVVVAGARSSLVALPHAPPDGRPHGARRADPRPVHRRRARPDACSPPAIRIARAEDATLVPAYLIVVPLEQPEDAPMQQQVTIAMPLLEAVEHAALRAGVPVDARIESGRTPDPRAASGSGRPSTSTGSSSRRPPAASGGFTPKDLTWMLTHAPSETLILRPDPGAPVRRTEKSLPLRRDRSPAGYLSGNAGSARKFSSVSQASVLSCESERSQEASHGRRERPSHTRGQGAPDEARGGALRDPARDRRPGGDARAAARLPARRRASADRGRPGPREDARDQVDGVGARRHRSRASSSRRTSSRATSSARGSSAPTSTSSTPSSARCSATSCSPTRSTARRRRCSRRCSR